MSVSVVIPTYNRIASLQDVLDGLRRQTFRSLEVVVVNGPSTDGTAEYLASLRDAVKTRSNPDRNLSRSRNLGIEAAAGDLVAFLDDDAVPEPRWLEDLAAAFDDDRVAGAGGLVLDHTGVRVQWRHLVSSRTGEHDFDQRPPLDRFVHPGADPFLYLAGGNSAFRRDALAGVGGFDEEIEYNFDETEVCLRLVDAGWVLRSLECAVVHHRNLPSHQRSAVAFTDPFFGVKNRVYFALRHGCAGAATAPALASATRDLGRLRVAAREAARAGRLAPDELARYLGRADAGFHVGLQRGLHGSRRGRTFRRADGSQLQRYPALDPPDRRRLAVIAPAPGVSVALAEAGHEVHELRIAGPDEPYRIDYDAGVWIHVVPDRPRWLPELDGSPLRGSLERLAALRGALAPIRAREPLEVEAELPQALRGFLDVGEDDLATLLERVAGLDRADAERAAFRLLDPGRFPTDHELAVRASLDQPDDGDFVDALYDALLGRAPEAYGRGTSLSHLLAGEERVALVERIASSPEAAGRGVDPSFVRGLPVVPLARAQATLRDAWARPDAEFARALHRLLLGDDARAASDAVRLRGGLVRRTVISELARLPAARERVAGVQHLPPAGVLTAAELRARIEDIARLAPAAFVDGAYRTLLGRAADPGGAADYEAALTRGGRSRAWVLRSLAASAEAAERGTPADVVEAVVRRSGRYRLDELRVRTRERLRRLRR
jgi:GT2 family glycosyltransferase